MDIFEKKIKKKYNIFNKMDNLDYYVKRIQKYWKLYQIRKKIKYFSQLPNDLWYLILKKLNIKYFHYGLDSVIENKIIEIYYIRPGVNNLRRIFRILFLVRYFIDYLHSKTIYMAFNLCQRCLLFPYLNLIQTHILNGFIEFSINNGYYNYKILQSKPLLFL